MARFNRQRRSLLRSGDSPAPSTVGRSGIVGQPSDCSHRVSKEYVALLKGCNATDDVQYNLPTSGELAANIVGDFDAGEYRFDILVHDRDFGLHRVSSLHPSYMALQYLLLFPYGERGFHLGRKYIDYDGVGRKYVTMLEYYRYMVHYRPNEPNPLTCYGRLSDQADVDVYSTIETNRLKFILEHQDDLRTESVEGIADVIDRGITNGDSIGKRVILHASFTGSRRYMVMNYQDVMAICRVFGSPDLFVTYTYNSKWLMNLLPTSETEGRLARFQQSYSDIRTYNNITYNTFREACNARGLLENDNEWHLLFDEAVVSASSRQLRQLFVTVILYCSVGNVRSLFDKYWIHMTDDIHDRIKKQLGNPHCLVSHEHLLNLLLHELKAQSFIDQLNPDQLVVFHAIVSRVVAGSPGFFFVSGHGGTGKIFLWNTIVAKLRSQNKIVLAVASSGVASLLLPKGRTAHSRFKIPLELNDSSICNIKRGNMLAELLTETALIIWDEAPMTHRQCFEALDWTLRDILSEVDPPNAVVPFGGKPIVLGGDFKQILPVVPKGSRSSIVNASIVNSYLWKHVTLLTLNINMRLLNTTLSSEKRKELQEFGEFILAVGNGTINVTATANDASPCWITIPDDLLVRTDGDKIAAIVYEVYPDFLLSYNNDPEYLASRAIVCPNNTTVDEINDYIIGLLPGDSVIYLSCDTISKCSEQIPDFDLLYPPKFLNSINCANFPAHKIALKQGATIMLLRNLNQSIGLCNGTRLWPQAHAN
ncbi:uncharacterized protein LOC121054713 [Oryza brachyantha]|uniref:uncharacterized protein LOC121054713 n=1 Tax=Oryza brachyantha TaxID=4533 RepID=UPI001ADC71A6|nr:uncharacterized protein LOC121054713 [Oryza brachyantha]